MFYCNGSSNLALARQQTLYRREELPIQIQYFVHLVERDKVDKFTVKLNEQQERAEAKGH